MSIIDSQHLTTVDEIADGIYRLSVPIPPSAFPGGFSFNQFLIADERPLLFHSGPRRLFPLVRAMVQHVLPPERLAYVALSHVEADECGSLNDFLAIAPQATPVCSVVAAMVSIDDLADRPARRLVDGEVLDLGRRRLRWLDAPHLPHGWDCGFAFEETTRTLLCGDLLTQPGHANPASTTADILGPSEAMRRQLDYYAHAVDAPARFEHLAATAPTTLACMHGSSWRGDGASLLRALAIAVGGGADAVVPAGARA